MYLFYTLSPQTHTGSEAEEGEDFCSEPDDSSDSWTTSEDFSNDVIVRCSNNRYSMRQNTKPKILLYSISKNNNIITTMSLQDHKPKHC